MYLTPDQIRRTREALRETHRLLSQELSYSPSRQNADMINFYRAHITKLDGMLLSGELPIEMQLRLG